MEKEVGRTTDVKIHLYLLGRLYEIGSGEITVIVKITEDKLDIGVCRTIDCEKKLTDEAALSGEEIKDWWKSLIINFSE